MSKEKALNKPFRLPKGSAKKFGVYVKNDKDNVVIVKFGDPNMEIRRDNPEARKSFRARHGCDTDAGPKWKAKYWSCRMWDSSITVSEVTKSTASISIAMTMDEAFFPTQEEILKICPEFRDAENSNEDEETS